MNISMLALGATALAVSAAAVADDKSDVQHGKQVFQYVCAPCHGDGPGSDGAKTLPGTAALQLKYQGTKPALLERRSDLPATVLKVFIRNGTVSMPMFRKTEVSDTDITAIAAYLARSAQQKAGVAAK